MSWPTLLLFVVAIDAVIFACAIHIDSRYANDPED
jgi:hypothetical protein